MTLSFSENGLAVFILPCRAFDVEMLYIAQQLGMPIKEVPVNWQEIDGTFVCVYCLAMAMIDVCLRACTGSKLVPVWSWLQMGRDILFIRLRYMFGIWKLHDTAKVKTN